MSSKDKTVQTHLKFLVFWKKVLPLSNNISTLKMKI